LLATEAGISPVKPVLQGALCAGNLNVGTFYVMSKFPKSYLILANIKDYLLILAPLKIGAC